MPMRDNSGCVNCQLQGCYLDTTVDVIFHLYLSGNNHHYLTNPLYLSNILDVYMTTCFPSTWYLQVIFIIQVTALHLLYFFFTLLVSQNKTIFFEKIIAWFVVNLDVCFVMMVVLFSNIHCYVSYYGHRWAAISDFVINNVLDLDMLWVYMEE